MTTQLPERLRALADEAPTALSGSALWQAGKRRHRMRVVVTAAVAGGLAVAFAAIGVGDWGSRRPDPAAPSVTQSGPVSIPARFFHPSPWLPGTRAPGRLVALLGCTRDHFPFGEDRNALVGVTAGSQAYHFLELPGQAEDTDVSLSPDGRHLAYWISGTPLGRARLGDRSVVGVANLDLTTGTVQRRVFASRHGLVPGTLTWAQETSLAVATGHLTSAQPTSYSDRTVVRLVMWSGSGVGLPPAGGGSRPVTFTRLPDSNVLPIPVTSTQGYGGMVDYRVLRLYDANAEVKQTIRLSGPLQSVAYDASTRRIAGSRGNPDSSVSTSGPLMVGHVVDGRARLSEVPRGRYLHVLGWADPGHVVTEQLLSTGEAFWVVDVRTGARTALTGTGYQASGSSWFGVSLAMDALRHPTTVAAVVPPRPWDPRWVWGSLLVALLLAGAAGVLVVRRSRRVQR